MTRLLTRLLTVFLICFTSFSFATGRPQPAPAPSQIKQSTLVNASASAGAFSSSGSFSASEGGKASSNLSINNPAQWPSSFVSGFSASSPAGCRTGLGVQGGYGGIVLPLDDEDCELAVAAQMELGRGNAWGYCKLMAKTEAYEIAEISFDDCLADHSSKAVTADTWLDEFNRKYPPLH